MVSLPPADSTLGSFFKLTCKVTVRLSIRSAILHRQEQQTIFSAAICCKGVAGANCCNRLSRRTSNSGRSSSPSCSSFAKKPCLREFIRARSLPAPVFGPVDLRAFAPFAAIVLSVTVFLIPIVSSSSSSRSSAEPALRLLQNRELVPRNWHREVLPRLSALA